MNELPRSPKLRQASFDDCEQISVLEHAYGLETKSREEWEHLWSRNPAYKGRGSSWPIGWVLEDDARRIVGYLGNIPLWYEWQGRRLIAAVTHAWVVDSPYRSYSTWLLDSYFRQENADLFLSTTVNAQASQAFGVFDSSPVPVGKWDQSAFWITHYQGFVTSWMRMKGSPMPGLLSRPLSAGLLLKDVLAGRSFRRNQNEVRVEPCIGFDRRFEIFWQELKTRLPHLLLAVRSREVLEWHFRYAIQKKDVWILTIANGSELIAYSIFCRQDNPRFGLERMRLVDFQTLEENSSLLLPMLSWVLQRCRSEGIDMLECIGPCPQQSVVFQNLRPRQRQLPSWMYFYNARDPELANSLEDPRAWNPYWFDGDSTL